MWNNYIYSPTRALFEQSLAAGEIGEGAIAFIEDTKEIWTRGQYFAGSSDSFGGILVGNDEATAEDGYIFIDEDDDSGINVYSKEETYSKNEVYNKEETYSKEEINNAISTAVGSIKTGMPVINLGSTTASTLAPGNFYTQTLSSSAVTYTLPSTGTYTATSTDALVEEIWLEFKKSSGSVSFSGGSVKWPDAETPTFTSGKTYQISFTAKYTSGSTVVWLAAVSREYTV